MADILKKAETEIKRHLNVFRPDDKNLLMVNIKCESMAFDAILEVTQKNVTHCGEIEGLLTKVKDSDPDLSYEAVGLCDKYSRSHKDKKEYFSSLLKALKAIKEVRDTNDDDDIQNLHKCIKSYEPVTV